MKRRFLAFVAMASAFSITLSACGTVDEPALQSASLASESILSESESVSSSSESVTFQILFTSDTHGVFDNFNYSTVQDMPGGLTKVAAVIGREKETFDGTTLVFDIGDTIQGNGTGYYIDHEKHATFPNVAVFEAIGYDAVVLGNHEFNFGYEPMVRAYEGFSGTKVTANVKDKDGNLLPGFEAYHVFDVDGLRVALVGLVTPNIDRWDPKTLQAANLTAYDAAETAKEVIAEIQAENAADIIILGGHMADVNEFGRSGSGATDVAQANPEITVFLGAHFHTIIGTKDEQHVLEGTDIKFVENVNNAGSVGKVIITATKEDGGWVVNNKSGDYDSSDVKTDVIAIDAQSPADSAIESVAKPFHDELYEYVTGTVLGKLEGGPLVPEPEIKGTYAGYLSDTPIGDLLLKVVMDAGGDDVDIAGINIPDENANLNPGDITIAGVSSIYKWADTTMLYKLEMTGAQVKKWMEWSATYFTPTIGDNKDHTKPAFNPKTDLTIPTGAIRGYNFDMFGGIRYEIDLTKPVGERVNILSMTDGSAFDPEKTYTVVSNDYRATTHLTTHTPDVFPEGEELSKILSEEIRNENDHMYMGDLIADYLAKQPNKTIQNTCDNNWAIVNLNWDPQMRELAVKAINEGLITTDFKTAVTVEQVQKLIDEGKLK